MFKKRQGNQGLDLRVSDHLKEGEVSTPGFGLVDDLVNILWFSRLIVVDVLLKRVKGRSRDY